ncbi:MAG: hypothetical protein ACD_12C00741G0002 [uncultured bacterium]|nr:MAG: hypothetical protein ACD_12C00741G0002 [uncultured bacterium]
MNLANLEQSTPQPLERRINPQKLFLDNQSDDAIRNRAEWKKAKEADNGQMTLFIVCGDARIVTTEIFGGKKIVSISSIAGSGDLKPFVNLLRDDYVGQIIVVGHFDHEKINDTGKIAGCGGVDTSKKLEEEKIKLENEELGEFLEQKVTPEFFDNVDKIVNEAALLSGKPVLGVLLDHLTYGAFPIIEQIGKQPLKLAYQNLKKFKKGQINNLEEFLTISSGIFPELKIEDLNNQFRKIIEKNRKRAKKRLIEDPDFIERQRTQNPSTVVVSTCPMPVALRYKKTFGRPNEAFVIRQPFVKSASGEIFIEDIDIKSIVGQIYYPLSHTLLNDPTKGFNSTKDLLIETPSLELSKQIADKLLKIQFIQDWMSQCGGKIMIGEIKEVETTQILPYP